MKCGARSKCRYNNGECVQSAKIKDIITIRKEFWGDPVIKAAPSQSERATKLLKLLIKSFNPIDKTFCFKLGENNQVCERGFLLGLGK